MSPDTRSDLAAMQAELVSALVGHSAVPIGFDSARIQTVVTVLAAKRLRAVRHAWPGLARDLGDRFAERFRAYALSNPLPRKGGPLADGRAFVRFLAADELPETAILQKLAVDLRYAATTDGLVSRRWPALKSALLNNPRRLIVGLRVPWLGQRWLSIPWWLP